MRKFRVNIGLLVIAWLFSQGAAHAADFWTEEFTGTAGQQPAGWMDETDNSDFNAEIAYSNTASWAAITRTAENTWGKVLSPVQNVDVSAYPVVSLVLTGVSVGATWKIGIQEQEGSYLHWDLTASRSDSGTFSFDYQSVTGWTSGAHLFSVEIIVEGNPGEYVEIDLVHIEEAGPPPITIWQDDFSGTGGEQPAGWWDESDDGTFNAEMMNSYAGEWAAITRTAEDVWGKVLSPPQTIDTALYPLIELIVNKVSDDAYWKIGIQEQGTGNRHWDLLGSTHHDGTFVFDYSAVTGWSGGSHIFRIGMVVEAGQGQFIEIESLRIHQAPSITPTITPTPFVETFEVNESPPAGWGYAVTYTAGPVTHTPEVLMYALGGYGYLSITAHADDSTGKAISPELTVDTDACPELWVWVTNISPASGEYNVSLKTRNVGNFPLFTQDQNSTGLKKINYAERIRQEFPTWSGVQSFEIVLSLTGDTGAFIEMQYIKFQPPAATPTITPTPVVNTLRPAANLFRPQEGPLRVQYLVQSTQKIKITVFSLAGRKIRTLLDWSGSGQVSDFVTWDGRNEAGDYVGSGVYIIRLESKDIENQTRFFENIRVAVVR